MPGTVLSMQNIYLVKKNYANPLEGDTKPPEGDNSMKFVYHQLNWLHENHTECWELQNRNCFTATTAAVAIAAAAASGGHGEIYCLRFTV